MFNTSYIGCTDISFVEYNIDANVDDGSCITSVVMGCTDNTYLEYWSYDCLLYTSPSPRDKRQSRMPSSA